ncbi:MAG: polysaccharide biosynthesis protein [Planctomycetaceae bacterium]|nr:polysaccharide biosynthesis protein [Planctomycetaceae bacterium]
MIVDQVRDSVFSDPPWTKLYSRATQLAMDGIVLAVAFVISYQLRFEFDVPESNLRRALIQLPGVVIIQFSALFVAGVYKFIWRYVGMAELRTFVRAVIYAIIPILVMRVAIPSDFAIFRVPFSIIMMDAVFAFGGILALRVIRRGIYERYERLVQQRRPQVRKRKPVLLIGAGHSGLSAIREAQRRAELDIEPVGIIDDMPTHQGALIHGFKVLGTSTELPRILEEYEIDHVIVSADEAEPETLRRILKTCEQKGVKVRILPGMHEIIDGTVSMSRIRDIQIEDLLRRDPIRLDEQVVRRFLAGRTAIVTGAGGSIGSELCRQIARFHVSRLILLERAEGALFAIEQQLRQLWPDLRIEAVVADVGDERRIRSILERLRPQVIFHAAAHKHVPMMQSNPGEAVKNNILGTRVIGRLAGECRVDAFVLISTDKAVNPSSIMGGSKRIAELVVQNLDRQFENTRFLAVRFGNVMGSNGSVIPIFQKQIERGGPVTVTHPEMTRYFMTIPEAAQLVLEAGAIGAGGDLMILDMGEPVKILDLAKDMITLSGHKPFGDLQIVYTGLRPGEKMFEKLEIEGEHIERTSNAKIFVGQVNAPPKETVDRIIEHLAEKAALGLDGEIAPTMAQILPEAEFADGDRTVTDSVLV